MRECVCVRVNDRGGEDDETVCVSVLLLETQHVFQRKLRAHVRVEDEELLRRTGQDLISEVIDPSSCPQSRVLLQVPQHHTSHH